MVDPGFQAGGHGEVVHRRADQHHVGSQQFVHQFVRGLDYQSLVGVALLGRRKEGVQHLFGQVRHGVGGQVALDDGVGRVGGPPLGDEFSA